MKWKLLVLRREKEMKWVLKNHVNDSFSPPSSPDADEICIGLRNECRCLSVVLFPPPHSTEHTSVRWGDPPPLPHP